MKTVSAMTMRHHFGGLLDEVRLKSTRVIIERDGKAVAMLTPIPESMAADTDRSRRLAALDRLSGMSPATARGRDPAGWLRRERDGWAGRES